ncbi:MAG: hypothetical protein GYB53_02480 [Rhodobacteraceae bacterium]|nr:hypothetical protein [Paracoccaceae bacterium]MBR9820205.1 hypothetical protein [Paracoccaceae bacterium]
MEMSINSRPEITGMAAACFPLARVAATGIELEVLDRIPPAPKREASKLAALLRVGKIFDKGVLSMLHELVGTLETEIEKGVYVETFVDNSPENVSTDRAWTSERRTPDADELSKALAVIVELYGHLSAVHDMLRAEQVLQEMRKAS